jgi:putative phosphoribosyl transferase
MPLPYKNRVDAGLQLAEALKQCAYRPDVVVLALPRGGVPVAYEIAKALDAPLDLLLVRKLGVPGREELAMGAIATGGTRVLNAEITREMTVSEAELDRVAAQELQTLQHREQAYRHERPVPEIHGRCVILVDDGLATGATMRAAIAAVRQNAPAEIVVAVPIAPPDTITSLSEEVDYVVCLATPQPFISIGRWYKDFAQVTDAEVCDLLERAWRNRLEGVDSPPRFE